MRPPTGYQVNTPLDESGNAIGPSVTTLTGYSAHTGVNIPDSTNAYGDSSGLGQQTLNQPQTLRPAWVPEGEPVLHSRYPDGTPAFEGMQPGKITGPLTDSQGKLVSDPHTVLQFDPVNGGVYKAREYGANGIPIRDIDFAHPTFPNGTLRPDHTAPEQHFYIPNDPLNPKAGYKRGPGQPIGG
ncbi:hypothetical protein J2S30_001566 [Herbaspirillum rubrisubalbicans]|uniref:hypothetical protein n=1 Tax=Herbaspirillum rubrisubalbicans TaxID=80842 RepID=UPI00209E5554|nr:hypothetical protein [Herbaspirillum rubrisubalbicans]MCP1573187.1 hypothetical protein [Herbaspirillum rubrisubalbicans]